MSEEELKTKGDEYETRILKYAKDQVPLWVKIALAGVLLALLIAGATARYYYLKHEYAVILSQQQVTDKAELSKALSISDNQAKKLATELAAAKNKEPNVTYVVQAPTVEQAACRSKRE